MLINIVRNYFDMFSKKDINEIENLFSSSISLKDWTVDISSKDQVIKFYKTFFSEVNKIDIKIINIYNVNKIVIAELEIFINNDKNILSVVDIIEFNEDNKIISIKAFKG